MNALWKIVLGGLSRVLRSLLPLIASEAAQFAADPEVRRWALMCVERVSKLDIDGDGKFAHAAAELRDALWPVRHKWRALYQGWLAFAVQAAYEEWSKLNGGVP